MTIKRDDPKPFLGSMQSSFYKDHFGTVSISTVMFISAFIKLLLLNMSKFLLLNM